MLQYVKSELYRLAHKKSTYIYYGSLIALFVGIMVFLVEIESATGFLNLGFGLIQVVALFVTTQVFMSVYCDDISSKTYSNTISTGVSRLTIILSKAVLFLLHTLIVFGALILVYLGLYIFYGGQFTAEDFTIITNLLKFLVAIIATNFAYSSLAAIFLVQFQSSTISVALYLFLNLGFVYNILRMVRNIIPFLDTLLEYSITELIINLMGSGSQVQLTWFFFGYMALYAIASTAISSFLFNKQEISV